MDRQTYLHLCDKAKEGREDIFVEHPSTSEGGMVLACDQENFVVKTSNGDEKIWPFAECRETLSRRDVFPYR